MKRILLSIILSGILSACSAGLGLNTDIIGPGKTEQIGYANFSASNDYIISDHWSLELSEEFIVIASKDGVRPGAGIKSKIRLRTWHDFSIYCGGGLSIIPDAGDIGGLAHSWLYGTIDFGVTWRDLYLGIDHISSPFHHAADGDSGLNFVTLRWRF